ncbi:alpha-E domain-containing protein [Pontiella sp.]|uniref:alpha-E domain-containing protein n=1 Tax=Pontiella sp. TaxID=2837462 RepID=UPI00356A5EDC
MLLSRVADNVYWMSRYIERASNIARFLEVSYLLNLDQPATAEEQWAPLIEITGDMKLFKARYGEATRENVMHFLMFNPEYPSSIASCLRIARSIAKGMRETVSTDMFREINALGKLVPAATREKADFHIKVFELCREIKRDAMLIEAMASETIERGQGYHFWRVGRYLERADKTSRLLHVKYFHLLPDLTEVGTPLDDLQWSALLESLDVRETYIRTKGLISPDKVVEMIVLDRGFPRAILFCLESALDSLYRITRDEPSRPHAILEKLCAELKGMSADDIIGRGMNEFIDDLQLSINEVNNAIHEQFISPKAVTAGA